MSADTDDVARHTVEDADDLDDFEYDVGDQFVMWRHRDDERAHDGEDRWTVCDRSFIGTVTWRLADEVAPDRQSHRCYKLHSANTSNQVYLSENELNGRRWKPAEEIDEDGGHR